MPDAVIKPSQLSETVTVTSEPLKDQPSTDRSIEEVPYLDYEQEHGSPYLVTHFSLGDHWNDPVGGFPKEVSIIEEYLKTQIEDGVLANSVDTIKNRIKEIEKVTGMNKEERKIIKMEVMAAYVEFLMKQDNIRYNVHRYGKISN